MVGILEIILWTWNFKKVSIFSFLWWPFWPPKKCFVIACNWKGWLECPICLITEFLLDLTNEPVPVMWSRCRWPTFDCDRTNSWTRSNSYYTKYFCFGWFGFSKLPEYPFLRHLKKKLFHFSLIPQNAPFMSNT